MSTYIYRCDDGHRVVSTEYGLSRCHCGRTLRRRYREEGFSLGPGIFTPEGMSLEERAALFLPMPEDFAGPDDPDGMKGLRKWREEHEPTKGDVIGDMLPKTVF